MLAKFAAKNINKRLVIVSMMIAVLAAGFWSGSRVPALNTPFFFVVRPRC